VGAFVSSLVYRWTGFPPAHVPSPTAGDHPPAAAATSDARESAARPVDRGRIRVAVLNAARVPGLADRMTELLRSGGFDVVSYDNARSPSDSTLILDRVGNPAFAREVGRALPGTPIRRQLARDEFVDVTVVVGRDYARVLRNPAPPSAGPTPAGTFERFRALLRRVRSALGL
jgi:hypothetical protein